MAHPQLSFPNLLPLLQGGLPGYFARTPRKVDPPRLMAFLVLMTGFGRKGYRRVLAELRSGMGRAFGWHDEDSFPSPQAIGHARLSLSREHCRQAFLAVQAGCTASAATPVAAYGGMRLLAIDGTRLGLAPAPKLIEHFGVPSNQTGDALAPMAGLVQLWDVGRNTPVAFVLAGCAFDERTCARELTAGIGRNDLLIGDRGFHSYEFFRELSCRRRCMFLLRIARTANREVIEFLASGQDEAVVRLTKRNHHGTRVDGTPAIPVRLLRIELPNGEIEVLATNLWRQRGHPRTTLAALYIQRWRIETAFREMKVYHALETFSATYPDGIYQEITAIQIFLLLVAEVEAMARASHPIAAPATPAAAPDPEPTAAPRELNPARITTPPAIDHGIRFNRVLIADCVIHCFRAYATGGNTELQRVLRLLLSDLWRYRSKARPGRQYPRIRRRPTRGYRKSGD